MDVHLLIYDLSRGLARQLSPQFLGFQLDAVYHTSIEIQQREWVYDGGIINITPGSSHLGKPLQRLLLGTTELPLEVIKEYIDSLRPIFTFEKYDLFKHNCNNFTDSMANFLLGKGIPDYIINMPEKVLNTPMGSMLMSQFTGGRQNSNGSILGLQDGGSPGGSAPGTSNTTPRNKVISVVTNAELSKLLNKAKDSCAVIFFTSATCAPCKLLYPVYDALAEEHAGQATFIKVDIAHPSASSIASAYSVRATPTLVTLLKGKEENRWQGADQALLRANVNLLIQMANPLHPHDKSRLPTFQNPKSEPVIFQKLPPMQKLMDKMGPENSTKHEVQSLKEFIEKRSSDGPQNAILPEMASIAQLVQTSVEQTAPEVLFAIVELFRCALIDPRVSGYFVEESGSKTVLSVIKAVNDNDACPYALRLVTLHTASNLFTTPLCNSVILQNGPLRAMVTQLISSSFLDDSHNNTRVAAASLLYNLALADRQARKQDAGAGLSSDDRTELTAAILEAITQEESSVEALEGMLTALGHLAYGTDIDGEMADLLRVMDAEGTILGKKSKFPQEKLLQEVGGELIGKGLRRR